MRTRGLTKQDFDEIVTVMDQWWGGPSGTKAEPLFFYEFGEHALVTEEDGTMVGFLLGFVTEKHPRVAYVHLIGIHPQFRRRGVAKALYQEFARRAESLGAVQIKAITTVGNQGSVDFHRALGFNIEESPEYAGPGRARYIFTRSLARTTSN